MEEFGVPNIGSYDTPSHRVKNYGPTFKHIILPLEPLKYISRSFDLGICKVVFDGDNLFVRHWSKLVEHYDLIKPSGFIMYFYTQPNHYERICEGRSEKYTKIGFKITKHHNYEVILNYTMELARSVDTNKRGIVDLLAYVMDGTLNLESFD